MSPPIVTASVINKSSDDIRCSTVIVPSALILPNELVVSALALIAPLAVMFPCAPNTFIEPETSNI